MPQANPDIYAERANASLSTYNAEPAVPSTQYAGKQSPLYSKDPMPTVKPKVRAFFKDNHWRLDGIVNSWSWGAVDQGANTSSLPFGGGMDGTVRSTQFQRALVQLHDWSQNLKWYICWNGTGGGMFAGSSPTRYNYFSFRVPQVNTSLTGGAGPVSMRMGRRPQYTAVQRVQKYSAQQRYYNTTSRNGGYNSPSGQSSNINTPGS